MYTETFQGGLYHHIIDPKRNWVSAHIYAPADGNFIYLYPSLKHLIADEFGMLAEFEVEKVILPKGTGIGYIANLIKGGQYNFKELKAQYDTSLV